MSDFPFKEPVCLPAGTAEWSKRAVAFLCTARRRRPRGIGDHLRRAAAGPHPHPLRDLVLESSVSTVRAAMRTRAEIAAGDPFSRVHANGGW